MRNIPIKEAEVGGLCAGEYRDDMMRHLPTGLSLLRGSIETAQPKRSLVPVGWHVLGLVSTISFPHSLTKDDVIYTA